MKKGWIISIEQFQYIALILFAFIMTGFGVLVSAKFNWEVFRDPDTWTSIGAQLTAHLSIILGGHKWKVYNENNNNQEILDKRKIIKTFSIKDKEADFYPFITSLDQANRKDAWLRKMQHKVDRLEFKGKTKKADKYRVFLTEEYIEPRLGSLRVRYKQIKVKKVINNSNYADDQEGFVNGVKFIIDYLTPKLLFTLAGILFSQTIMPVLIEPDRATVYKLLYDGIILLLSFMWGTGLADSYIEKVEIANLDYRIDILRQYLNTKR